VHFAKYSLWDKTKRRMFEFVVMYSSIYPKVEELSSAVKLGRGFGDDGVAAPRFCAVACGPVVGHGVFWEPRHFNSVLAGINKNHAEQVAECWLSDDLLQLAQDYAHAEACGTYDALSRPYQSPCSLLSEDEVIAIVALKSPSKARRYLADFTEYISSFICSGRAKCKLKVKPEILKLGKSPRVIHDLDSGETVLAHSWAILLEMWIKTTLCWKGLRTNQKCVPFCDACQHFNNDCYLVCLDDEARDSNTLRINFVVLCMLLEALGIHIRGVYFRCLMRAGVVLVTCFGIVISPFIRLKSGVSYTSGMNYVTSRFDWFCILYWLEVPVSAYIVCAEGDDNFACIEGNIVRRLGLESCFGTDQLRMFGLKLGKRLKMEKQGWLRDGTSWPAVGGDSVYLAADWGFIPSLPRCLIKAGWAINNDWESFKVVAGRVSARAWALNDRFDRVPIWWAYARVVAAYAAHLGCPPIFDADEEYQREDQCWSGGLANEPSVLQRRMYEVAFGVGCGNQLICESLLLQCISDQDYTRDLTREFGALLCRD